MRTAVVFVLFALIVIACAAPQQSEPLSSSTTPPPPLVVEIELDANMTERLAIGLPMHVGLRAANTDVGSCTLSFDLWDEQYLVAFSKKYVLHAPDPKSAVRLCVDMDRVKRAARGKRVATIEVREIEPLKPVYPRRAYPEF